MEGYIGLEHTLVMCLSHQHSSASQAVNSQQKTSSDIRLTQTKDSSAMNNNNSNSNTRGGGGRGRGSPAGSGGRNSSATAGMVDAGTQTRGPPERYGMFPAINPNLSWEGVPGGPPPSLERTLRSPGGPSRQTPPRQTPPRRSRNPRQTPPRQTPSANPGRMPPVFDQAPNTAGNPAGGPFHGGGMIPGMNLTYSPEPLPSPVSGGSSSGSPAGSPGRGGYSHGSVHGNPFAVDGAPSGEGMTATAGPSMQMLLQPFSPDQGNIPPQNTPDGPGRGRGGMPPLPPWSPGQENVPPQNTPGGRGRGRGGMPPPPWWPAQHNMPPR